MDSNHVHHFWGLSHPLDLKYLSSGARTLAAALGTSASLADQPEPTNLNVLQVLREYVNTNQEEGTMRDQPS